MSEEQNKPEEGAVPMDTGSKEELPNSNENVLSNSAPLEQETMPQTEKQFSSEEPQTQTEAQPEPQTTAMEVHHHGHVHEKKKWKEYLFQFLMLFLAVFCGFLAEYQLEHKIERDRAKQYIQSFYDDLKTDTARVSIYLGYNDVKLATLDNLSNCYNTVSKSSETSCLLDVIKISSINRPYKTTERTLSQLANAGGFRLLHQEDADSIKSYQKEFGNFQDFQETVYQDAQNNVRNTFNLIIDFSANAQMFQPKKARLISTFRNEDVTAPLLFSDDRALLNRYFNDLQLYYRVTYNQKGMLLNLKDNQIRLINYFKNKYGME